MKDKFSREKRSEIMSLIKGKNTKLELIIFQELKKRKIYFKKHYEKVIGSPDLAFPDKKKAIFIDGDFWHGWQYPKWKKKLTSDFWVRKIDSNRKRDVKINRILKKKGWKVLRVWEHQIKKEKEKMVERIITFLGQK